MYQNPTRNSEAIRWQTLRESADLAAIEMDDEVSARYYDHWRSGVSMPWGPFDTLGGGIPDRVQFNLLTTMVEDMHLVMLHKINKRMNQLGEPGVIPQDEYRYDYLYDDEGNVIETFDRVQEARDRMNVTTLQLGVETKQMTDHYLKRTKDLSGYTFTNWDVD